ncbi:S53 family peptidase [Xanthomonas sp. GPE 39]|uniref:S53 family peptidase n=1 Tax=Xanthomonas sp. GPE 39 TaxID=1583099 RepID=UPI0005F279AB|nr:S53 family peptidase [Xanthomonas sp. GPE 39]
MHLFAFRRTLLAIALCGSIANAAAVPGNDWVATTTASQVVAGHAIAQPNQSLTPAPLDATLEISILLRPADPAALQQASAALAAQIVNDPALRSRVKTLTMPNATDVQRIKDYLLGKGISDVHVAGNGRLLQAKASVAAIQAAFDTAIRSYTDNGQRYYVNDGAAKVPAALASSVAGVLGLDTVRRAATPHVLLAQVDATATSANIPSQNATASKGTVAVMHQVEDLPVLYNAASLPPASRSTAAIIAAGNLENTLVHLASFQAQHRLQTIVQVVQVGDPASPGFRPSNFNKQEEVEWDMNTQLLLGSAGGLRRLIIYNVPDFSYKSLVDGVQRAVDDDAANVISTPIYGPEGTVSQDIYQALDASLTQAVSNGQNFLFCTGDDGIYTPQSASDTPPYYPSLLGKPEQRQVGFPASHPYAIAVGATELRTPAGARTTYGNEVAWNAHRGHGITQGGSSKLYAAPSWQKTLIPDMVSNGYRAVPDVSFNGSGDSSAYILQTDRYGGEFSGYVYGSSAATPTFAGLLARVLQANGNRIGFISPALYAYAKNAGSRRDVVSGDNGLYGDGYNAAPGWDFVSGWGSVDMLAFSRYLQSQ